MTHPTGNGVARPGIGADTACDACGRTQQTSSMSVLVWAPMDSQGNVHDVGIGNTTGRTVCVTCREAVAVLLRSRGLPSR